VELELGIGIGIRIGGLGYRWRMEHEDVHESLDGFLRQIMKIPSSFRYDYIHAYRCPYKHQIQELRFRRAIGYSPPPCLLSQLLQEWKAKIQALSYIHLHLYILYSIQLVLKTVPNMF
jgi:hypothetical protein